ncbi:TetR/AcrR family transcriptional regulator [Variovorax sp. Root411]|uniref:TetR/AcrR family transcriptional regulator n=1 Tax=Variovorax sp. Root411 TaxID=1736530 RepID=UPI002AA2A368|nr:TetR/AcrR family transcriptional regulator [Variovorax sp. Root411]
MATRYHHGNLREALIEAAVELIERDGLDKLSVREAAKRAGVSPGAPFRHFATKTALLTAVAVQATQRLRAHVQEAVAAAADASPLVRFGAIGHAYIEWAQAQRRPATKKKHRPRKKPGRVCQQNANERPGSAPLQQRRNFSGGSGERPTTPSPRRARRRHRSPPGRASSRPAG